MDINNFYMLVCLTVAFMAALLGGKCEKEKFNLFSIICAFVCGISLGGFVCFLLRTVHF